MREDFTCTRTTHSLADGIVDCICCGRGDILEYTYCQRNLPASDHDKEDEDLHKFCRERDDTGNLILCKQSSTSTDEHM